MIQTRFIFPFTPKTKVDVTHSTWKLFNIPEDCYKGYRKKGCKDFKRTGTCKHVLSEYGKKLKRRIERYNDYKSTILGYAKKIGFTLPAYGWSVYFHIPIPKRWTLADRKKMNGQMHHRKPDWDNLCKAIQDSLTFNDEYISQVSGTGKFWVDTKTGPKVVDPIGPGYIEFLLNQPVYNPHHVEFIDQSKVPSLRAEVDYRKRREEGKTRKFVKKSKDILE